jgi:hypothetical protein
MDIREYLESLKFIQDQTATAATSAEDMRKMRAKRELEANASQMIQNKDLGGLVSGSLQAGMTQPFESTVSAMATTLKPTSIKPGDEPPTEAERAFWEEQTGMKLPPNTTRKQMVEQAKFASGVDFKERKDKRDESDADRRWKKFYFDTGIKFETDQAKAFGTPLVKKKMEIDEANAGIDSKIKAFKEKPTQKAANLLARAMLLASGDNRISNTDVEDFSFKSFPGGLEELKNKFKGGAEVSLTGDEQQELYRLARHLKDTLKVKKKKVLGDMLKAQVFIHPEMTSGAEPSPIVKHFADESGLEVTKQQDGKIEFKDKDQKPYDVKAPAWVDKLTGDTKAAAIKWGKKKTRSAEDSDKKRQQLEAQGVKL